MAVQPQILTKSGRKGAGKHFLTVLVFSGAVWKESKFLGFEFGLVTKYFILKPLKNANMTMQYFAEFFLKMAGKPW